MSKKAIIIGAGIGGLATSIRLASKGYTVDVYERADKAGGKLTDFQLGAYRFDYGPSLFTLPQYVDELLALSPQQYNFGYDRLDNVCHYYYPDGLYLTAWSDAQRFANEIELKMQIDGQKILDYLEHLRKIYELVAEIFLHKSLHKLSTYTSAKTFSALIRSHKMHLFSSMHHVNLRHLGDPRLVQLFDRFATYNGSNPYKAPGILNTIACLEHLYGAYFPKGGMYSITEALYQTAIGLGVKFHFNQSVDRILLKGNRADGIEISGDKLSADLIVSNADIFQTYHKLLAADKVPSSLRQEKSSSAMVFYWGLQKKSRLGLHSILFSKDYKQEFDFLFNKKRLSEDPTVYINISSNHCPSDAPANCENWFVMINAPARQNPISPNIIQHTKNIILDKIFSVVGFSVEDYIMEERILTPRGIADDTGSYMGALYGNSSNNPLAAFFRHPNFSRKYKSLYFVGGSAHPGGGIPLCLLSAKIVANLIPDA